MSGGVFQDCYRGRLGSPEASQRELVALGLTAMPGWVGAAMWLRNRLVAPLGLKTGAEHVRHDALVQHLPVIYEDGKEFVTGMNDRHLDFDIRLTKTNDSGFELATRVTPHNTLGRIYLALVLPAHRVIMRRMARGLAQPIREDR